jgi:thioesterase domain-containing protein
VTKKYNCFYQLQKNNIVYLTHQFKDELMDTLQERIKNLSPDQRELLERKMDIINKNKDKNKILLPLQEGIPSKRRPLFCIHPPLGVTGYFINMVRHLNPEQPVYGIQSPAFYNIRPPFDDMTEMADYYLKAIRSIQAEPPYFLIGHSSGANIAYEMAIQLQNEQKEIPIIVFLDATAPIGEQEQIMNAFKDPNLIESDEAMFLTAWLVSLAYGQNLTFSMEDLKSCNSLGEKYELIAGFLKGAGFIPANADNDMVKIVLQMIANHTIADTKYHERFTPGGADIKYKGQTVLMRCTEETVWQGFDIISQADTSESSGWEHFCSGPIDIVGIPDSNHITMIMEPCVKDIADSLQHYLDKITPIA